MFPRFLWENILLFVDNQTWQSLSCSCKLLVELCKNVNIMQERCRVQQLPHGRYLNFDLHQYEEWINGQRWGRMSSIYEDDESYSEWHRGRQHGLELKHDPAMQCKTSRYFEKGLQAGWEETWIKHYQTEEGEAQLCSLSQWSFGKRHGIKLCFSSGCLEGYDEWDNGQRHGHFAVYSHSRKSMIWTKIAGAQFLGPESVYHAKGIDTISLVAEEQIQNGFRIGYYRDSKIRYIQFFCNGLQEGSECHYAETGQLIARHEWLHGKRHGVWIDYNLDGEMKAKACWSKGLPVGIHYEWYPKRRGGGIKSLIPHNQGQRNGTQFVYFSTGQIKSKTQWKQGYLHGPCYSFFLDGQPCMEIHWKNGQKHGVEREWCGGQLILDKQWCRDQPDGVHRTFNRTSGALESEVNWSQGQLNGLLRCWNEEILERQQLWVDNQKQGFSEHYHSNGVLRARTMYKDGLRHGTEEHYNQTGQLVHLKTWQFGKQEDLELLFDENQNLTEIYSYQSGLKHGFSCTNLGNVYYMRGCPIPDDVLRLGNTQFHLDPEKQSPLIHISDIPNQELQQLLQPPRPNPQSPKQILSAANIDWKNLGYFCPKSFGRIFSN